MSYCHFTTYERGQVEILHNEGYSARQIAKAIGRSNSSISRELKRNSQHCIYEAPMAQEKYTARRKASVSKGKFTSSLKDVIEEKLNATWSPEQIAETANLNISFKTIYRWLYEGKLCNGYLTVLRHKGRRRKPQETRGKFNIGTSISKRPKEVNNRETFGHWELDTVVSSRGKSKGCFATFIERQSRYYTAIKMPDRTAKSMKVAIEQLHKQYPQQAFKSFTTDRGKEFSCYASIEEDLNIPVYFADAYSSWQRGSNENANGLLREFFPKGTDLALVSEIELNQALSLINNRPRKILSWASANNVFSEKVLHLA